MHLLLGLCLAAGLLWSAVPKKYWGYTDKIDLKKDQVVYYEINSPDYTFPFFFRWTLYKSQMLVMHYSFDGFRRQDTLMLDQKLDTFRYYYRDRKEKSDEKPMIMIRFANYFDTNKTARFEVFVRDPKRIIVGERNMTQQRVR